MRKIIKDKKYKHFKGQIYKVICIAYDSEANNESEFKKLVVYQALDGEKLIWVRDYDMFASLVDIEKYPEVKQTYRFEEID